MGILDEDQSIASLDEVCDVCRFCAGPLFHMCVNPHSEFCDGPVHPLGSCPHFKQREAGQGSPTLV